MTARGPGLSARSFALLAMLLVFAALVLRRASLHAGWFADDYVQHSLLDGNMWPRRGMWDLHDAIRSGDASDLIHRGALPWWTEPTMVFAPLRPLTSVLMWWEYHFFGKDAVALHAVSFGLWALFAGLTLRAYATTLPRRAALIAAIVFVLSPAHSEAVSWVATQSLLVSATFGTLALNLYAGFRRAGGAGRRAAYVIAYACALLGGENGLAFVGYFCAYELFCARDGVRKRIAALAPLGFASAAYLAWRAAGGYGIHGVTYYVDLSSLPHLWRTFSGSVPAHIARGLAGPVFESGEPGMLGWALAALLLTGGLLRATGLVRNARLEPAGKIAAAWLIGAILSTLPYGAASFSVRVGTIPFIGFAAAVGVLIDALLARLLERAPLRVASTWGLAGALAYLSLAHGAYAGYESYAAVRRTVERYQTHAARAAHVPALDEADAPAPSHVFLIHALHVPIAQTVGLARVAHGRPFALWRVLSPAPGPHLIMRTSERSFVMQTTTHGIFTNPSALVYRRADSAIDEGSTIRTAELSVRVLERGVGGPFTIEFTFDEPLESPRYRFLVAREQGFEAFAFAPVNHIAVVPPALPPAGWNEE